VLAAYALWLRIGQYGLTPDRVFAAAYLVVAAGFTVGYAVAALRPGAWMKTLEPTNLIMAAVSVLLLIALFTPIADPARLSVGSQVKRLETGKVAPDKFDFQFLRFEGGRYGRRRAGPPEGRPNATSPGGRVTGRRPGKTPARPVDQSRPDFAKHDGLSHRASPARRASRARTGAYATGGIGLHLRRHEVLGAW
jgi:hypothetical protein